MPVPIVIWAAVALTSALGAKKALDGAANIRDANNLAESEKNRHAKSADELEARRRQVVERAQAYASHLVLLQQTTLSETRELLRALQQRPKTRNLRVPDDVRVSNPTLEGFKRQVLDPPRDLATTLGAMSAGAAAGTTTVGLVGLFATASTGTAIGSLSGAAATNATLAWLGGGSLAAGGGGMAAGAVTLGGVMLAPALVIGGFALASKGEQALTQARRYAADVSIAVSKITSAILLLDQIVVRIDELMTLCSRLNQHARAALSQIDVDTFDPDSDEDMTGLTLALQLVQAMSEVMQTPILSEDGMLTDASLSIQLRYRELAAEGR